MSQTRKSTSARASARQNLLVAAVNVALERGLVTLGCETVTKAVFDFTLGGHPVLAFVSDVGFDEVAVYVTYCPTKLGREFAECTHLHDWRRSGEAFTFGWSERRSGKYLQSGVSYHGTKTITKSLAGLLIEPLGFGTEPIKGGYDYFLEYDRAFGRTQKVAMQRPVMPAASLK